MTTHNTDTLPFIYTDEKLESVLKRFKLSAIRTQLPELLKYCEEAHLTPRQTLCYLLRAEEVQRDLHGQEMMIRMARFPFGATLENFDFTFSSLDRNKILELSGCGFIGRCENILLSGESGLGKTHLAIALGRCAITHGYSAQFLTADELFTSLVKSCDEGTLDQRVEKLRQFKLLIIDELGYTPTPHNVELASLFYKLIDARYMSKSTATIITTNRPMYDWPAYFGGDSNCIKATLDRFLERVCILVPSGRSYRTKDLKSKGGINVRLEG